MALIKGLSSVAQLGLVCIRYRAGVLLVTSSSRGQIVLHCPLLIEQNVVLHRKRVLDYGTKTRNHRAFLCRGRQMALSV